MKFWICIPMETSACLIRMSAIAMSLPRSAASAWFKEFSASPSSAPSFFAFAIIVETEWTRVSYFSMKRFVRVSSIAARASARPRWKPSTSPLSMDFRAASRWERADTAGMSSCSDCVTISSRDRISSMERFTICFRFASKRRSWRSPLSRYTSSMSSAAAASCACARYSSSSSGERPSESPSSINEAKVSTTEARCLRRAASISSEMRFAYPSTSAYSPASTSASARARSSEAMRTSAPSFACASSFARSSARLSRMRRESFLRRASSRMSSMTFLYSIASTKRRSLIASRAFWRTESARPGSIPMDRFFSMTRSTDVTRSFAADSSPVERAAAISSVSPSAGATSPKRPESKAASARARASSAPRIEMSARDRSPIVFRIAPIRARAASCALRRDSVACSEKILRASTIFCSAARACSTASAYSPRSRCASAVSSKATASSVWMPFSRPSLILRSARPIRFFAAAMSSSISSFAVASSVVRIASTSSKFRFSRALRRGDEVVPRVQEAAFERLFGARQGGGRPSQVEVLGDQVRDVRPHDFHATMDPFHPFELDPRLLGDGLSLRVRVRLCQLLDLGDARLPSVDRVAVAGLGIRGLGVLEHLVRGVDRDAVRPRTGDLPAGLSEDLGRRAPQRLAGRGDVMLDAVQERVGLEVSAFLHRDRGVGELPLERDRVRLARLTEGDNVVPGPEDAFVQLALRLGVLVLHPLVDQGLHVDGLAQRDGVVDFPEELAGDDRIQAAGRVRQDDLQRPLHDRAEVRLPRRLRPAPGLRHEPPRRRKVVPFDRLAELDEHPFEVRDLGAHRADLLRVEPEACERLPHGLQEGRLPDRVVGVLREASDLRVLLRLEGLGPLGPDRLRAAELCPR